MGAAPRTVALDWSGARDDGGRKGIWTAEVADGRLVELRNGRTRGEAMRHLIELAEGCADLVVGLDFSFSLPERFAAAHGAHTVEDVWKLAKERGDGWLKECEPPFYGRADRKKDRGYEHFFRRTEQALRDHGKPVKSVFQLGAGQVGPGSLRGMPLLAGLREAQFAIWPFDPVEPGRPMVVEMYPRLLTGPVKKSNVIARADKVAEYEQRMDGNLALRAAGSEDSFDAALSALEMDRRRDELRGLGPIVGADVEGWIWPPIQ